MLADVNVGDFIQIGGQIASIVPQDEGGYQVDVYIDNQNSWEKNNIFQIFFRRIRYIRLILVM